MPAAYDTYDYPSYWEGRDYEHKSEVIALKSFLEKIKSIDTILDIGAGYGRLSPLYLFRSKKIILSDPSAKLLKIARNISISKKVKYIQSKLENLNSKIKKGSVDVILLIRVLHHIKDLDEAFFTFNRLIKKGGYLILEYPNKKHLKATFLQLFKGNITFPFDIFPKDLRSKKSIRKNDLPFVNYHPDFIKELLKNYGFKIVESRSVSNIRSPYLKKKIPLEVLLFFEKCLQNILSYINFGPSIFILAKKYK